MTTSDLQPRRMLVAMLAVALGATLGATPAQAQTPTGTIIGAGQPSAVPDSYLVVLREEIGTSHGVNTRAADLAGRYGGQIGHTYHAALTGFSVSMTEPAARRLAADPAVAYVEQDQRVQTSGTQPTPPSWGLDRIDQRTRPLNRGYEYPTTGAGVRAYVIDSGIVIGHPDFEFRASYGWDVFLNGPYGWDCHGHGTHVAGTIGSATYGVAKDVQLVAVKVLDCFAEGTTGGVVAGVDWVTANAVHPAVANMSLGFGGISHTVDLAVANSISSGITYVLSAGNDNANACDRSPARVPQAITVGATRSDDRRASFSNTGPCLDLFAPGKDITSTWRTGGAIGLSGTSMAAPHVTGAAALVLSTHPGWAPVMIENHLRLRATTGQVADPGNNSPNRLLYIQPVPTIDWIGCNPAGTWVTCGSAVTGLWTQIRWWAGSTPVPPDGVIETAMKFQPDCGTTTVRVEVSYGHGTASATTPVTITC